MCAGHQRRAHALLLRDCPDGRVTIGLRRGPCAVHSRRRRGRLARARIRSFVRQPVPQALTAANAPASVITTTCRRSCRAARLLGREEQEARRPSTSSQRKASSVAQKGWWRTRSLNDNRPSGPTRRVILVVKRTLRLGFDAPRSSSGCARPAVVYTERPIGQTIYTWTLQSVDGCARRRARRQRLSATSNFNVVVLVPRRRPPLGGEVAREHRRLGRRRVNSSRSVYWPTRRAWRPKIRGG